MLRFFEGSGKKVTSRHVSSGKMQILGSWWLDLKLGMRMLGKYPALSLAGVTGIAVAVAIAAGGYSVVQRNLMPGSLPLAESDQIVAMELWDTKTGRGEARLLSDFAVWREGVRTIREISAYRTLTPNLITPGAPPESVRVAAMSASGFGVARVAPLLGRTLTEADERTGAAPVVVVSESVWRNRFGSDPAILGRTIQLGTRAHAIAGVMPKGFGFPVNHSYWVPLVESGAGREALSGPEIGVFGRLTAGASLESAQAELAAYGQRRAAEVPQIYERLRARVAPYTQAVLQLSGSDDMAAVMAMQGLVVSLLVLVCLNVAILVYTRTAMRQAEIGLRTALGASRGRIVAQLFLEALVLAMLAALGGIGLAWLALRQLTAETQHIAGDLPFWLSFELTWEGAVYAGTLGILAALIVGVLPGLQATGRGLQSGMRIAGAGEGGMRLGRTWTVLIVAQAGFAVAILPPSVLSGWRSLEAGMAGPGFAAEEYLTARLGMDEEGGGAERFGVKQAELIRQLESEPGVAGVTYAMTEAGDERGARIEAQDTEGGVRAVRWNRVAKNYFATFGVAILAGQGLEANPGMVVVNEALASRVFGGNAVGKRIRYAEEGGAEAGRWYEIGGVAANFPVGASAGISDSDMKIYHAGGHGEARPAVLTVRLRGAPAAFGQRLREMAAKVDAGLYVREIQSLDAALRKEQWIRRLEAGVLLAVTVIVVLLSSAGIYALLSFTVSQRRREIGIRVALGAGRAEIVRAIFLRAFLQLGAGVVVGAALGVPMAVAVGDGRGGGGEGAVLLAVVLAVMVVGVLALLGPTLRSLRVEPTEALREY